MYDADAGAYGHPPLAGRVARAGGEMLGDRAGDHLVIKYGDMNS